MEKCKQHSSFLHDKGFQGVSYIRSIFKSLITIETKIFVRWEYQKSLIYCLGLD